MNRTCARMVFFSVILSFVRHSRLRSGIQ